MRASEQAAAGSVAAQPGCAHTIVEAATEMIGRAVEGLAVCLEKTIAIKAVKYHAAYPASAAGTCVRRLREFRDTRAEADGALARFRAAISEASLAVEA